MTKFVFVLLFLLTSQVSAEISMNDIRLLQFGDFTEKWRLVTVRYRQDSKEMRFTYANPAAWKGLKSGASVYPDGAVFAKVGFKSGVDPAFSSSIVPSGTRRFQFMVKNAKKYSQTDGWGYALFQSNGELFEGDPKTASMACHACHSVVPHRDYVFSQAIEMSPLMSSEPQSDVKAKDRSKVVYVLLEKKDLKNNLKKMQKQIGVNSILILDGEMRQHYFGGTLDEVTPLLIDQALKNEGAAGFVSEDQNTFKILRLSKLSKSCSENEVALDIFEYRKEWPTHRAIEKKQICYSKSNL